MICITEDIYEGEIGDACGVICPRCGYECMYLSYAPMECDECKEPLPAANELQHYQRARMRYYRKGVYGWMSHMWQ
jgi:hypothetical protein